MNVLTTEFLLQKDDYMEHKLYFNLKQVSMLV